MTLKDLIKELQAQGFTESEILADQRVKNFKEKPVKEQEVQDLEKPILGPQEDFNFADSVKTGVVADQGAAVTTEIENAPNVDTIFNNSRPGLVSYGEEKVNPRTKYNPYTYKPAKFMGGSIEDKNKETARILEEERIAEEARKNTPEYLGSINSFESATKSYMNNFLPLENASELNLYEQNKFYDEQGLDSDQRDFASLRDNPAFRKKVIKEVRTNQLAQGLPLPDLEDIDGIFEQIQNEFVFETQKALQIENAIEVTNASSPKVITTQARILKEELNLDQQELRLLNDEAKVLLYTIKNSNSSEVVSDAQEKLRLTAIKMKEVAQSGDITKYGDSSEVQFLYNVVNGERMGTGIIPKEELDEINKEDPSEFKKIQNWTEEILDKTEEIKALPSDEIEAGYNFMLLEWAENVNDLNKTVDLGGFSKETLQKLNTANPLLRVNPIKIQSEINVLKEELETFSIVSNEYGEIAKEIETKENELKLAQENYEPGVAGKMDPLLRLSLIDSGYKPDAAGVFRNVKLSDLVNYRSEEGQEVINNAIYTPYSEGDQLTSGFSGENLRVLVRKRNELLKQREAYKAGYLMNIDASTIKQTLGSSYQFLEEEVTESILGDKPNPTNGYSVQAGKGFMDELGITLSKEQKDRVKSPFYQKLVSELVAFAPDLAQFFVLNKMLGATGITTRIGRLLGSANANTRTMGHAINALLEEGKFKLVTRGKSQDLGGVGFYLGGKFVNKLLPFRFSGANARLNPFLEKGVYGGAGGVGGANVALVAEAVYKDLMNSQAFKTSMEIDYGEDSDFAAKNFVSYFTFLLIGMSGMKSRDFDSMRTKRLDKVKTEKEIIELREKRTLNIKEGFENTSVIDGKINQKQNFLDLINRDIKIADREFNNLDIGSQISGRDSAQEALNSGKLSVQDAALAKERINQVNANIEAATTKINKTFDNVVKSGVLGKNVKMMITEGTEGFQNKNNKAEYDIINDRILIDVTKYVPGVVNHEIFHVFYRMAVGNNPKVAKVLKNSIKNTVEKSLSNETFTFEGETGLSFEQAIDLAYGKNRPAEEYVSNVVEFLSQPKYQDLLLKKGLIAGLTRNVDFIKNKIGLTTGAKQVDFTNAGETLKFLFDLKENFEGGTKKSLQRAYDLLQGIEVKGDKLFDKNTGQEVSEANVMPSVDIKVSELALEYKDRNKEGQKMSDADVKSFQDQYIAIGIEAVSKWAAEKGVPVSAIKNNPDIQGKLIDQLESITKNYKPINSETGKEQSLTTYMYNTLGKRVGPSIVEAYNRLLNERSTDSEFVKELEAGVTESNVDRLAREGLEKDQIDLRDFINNAETRKKVEDAVKIEKGDLSSLLTGKNVNQKFIGPVGEALLGLSEAKILGNETLNYGLESRDASKMQQLFRDLQQTMKFIEAMPKYNVGTNEAIINKQGEKIEVSSDARGYSIGINRTILNKYYKPYVDPTKKMTTPKGKSKGKTSQPKVYILDFKPTIENARKLQKDIGITPSGEMNVPIKGPARTEFGTTLQGLTKLYASNLVNTIVRSKIDAEVVGAKGVKQTKADIKAGFSNRLASAEIKTEIKLKGIQGEFAKIANKIDQTTVFQRPRKDVVKSLTSIEFIKAYYEGFGESSLPSLKPQSAAPAGNKANPTILPNGKLKSNSGAIARGQFLINQAERARKEIDKVESKKLVEQGEIGELYKIQQTIKEISKEALENKELTKEQKLEIENINLTYLSQTIKDIPRNLKTRDKHIAGFKAKLDKERAWIKKYPQYLGELIFLRRYNVNANNAGYRTDAQIIQKANLKPGEKGYEEHPMPAGAVNIKLAESLLAPKAEYERARDYFAENYIQEVIDFPTQKIVDGYNVGSYKFDSKTGEKLTTWDSKSKFHPVLDIQLDKYIKGEISKNEIPHRDIRYANEYYGTNLNKLNKAKRWSVVVPEKYWENKNIIDLTSRLAYRQILTEAGLLKGSNLALTGKRSQEIVDVYVKKNGGKLLKDIIKAQKQNVESYGSKLIGVETIGKQVEVLENYDKARSEGVKKNKPVRKIRVMDLDDTLLKSKSKISVEMPDGTTFKINATEFAKRAAELETKGAEFDFTEFEKIIDGKKGPLFKVLENINAKNGTKDFFILTARPAAAAPAIKEFFDALGIPIPIENIVGLGDGKASAKANWIAKKAGEGYNDFYFADDAIKNVEAVREVLDQIDVKSKVQLALASKKIMFDKVFNDIIEQSTGIESYKEFSAAKAKTIGSKKGRFTFFTTPSAEDFLGLLYKTLGKGKIGDAQIDFYNKNLIDTYNRAELAVTDAKISAAQDFKALKTNLKSLPKSLSKETGIGGFTFSHAARVSVWTKQGMKIPGLSKADVKELNDFVNKNAELTVFTDQLIQLQKGKLYPEPTKEWLAGNITTDVIGGINKVNRKQYLQEWQENVDIIFSDKNLNKLEAAYGSKYREALSETLYRMKTGSNRPLGGSRIVNEMMDWLNNSVGSIMFLNTRTAVLQTISSVNFLNWGNNNLLKAGKAFANQPQYWKDFKTLMNSPYLTERRDGLKINVSESEIADAVSQSRNKASGAINYLLNKGFVFTRIADSFAIAAGGSTFYRNQIKAYVKSGMEIKAAEKQAFEDFYAIAETNQQSSNASKISQQQASAAGRVVLAFGNTPMQYNRIIKKATQDLVAGRGDYKTHLSKIAYYAGMQNFVFNALQNALFAEAFGEDEEGDDEKLRAKQGRIADGMTDSLLRGVGIQGAAVSAVKDALVTIYKENNKEKGTPKYEKAIDDLIGFSPPLSSKIRKLKSAANTFSWDKKKINQEGFNLNNPAYLASANIVSATTNIPLDRAIKKINNMRNVFSENSEAWQKVAMTMGWSSWDVGLPYYGVEGASKPKTPAMIFEDTITEMKKNTSSKEQKQTLINLGVSRSELNKYKYEEDRIKKILELEKEFKDNPKKKDSLIKVNERKTIIFKDNKTEQVNALLALGLTKEQIATLKYEKNRVDKIIELQNKK